MSADEHICDQKMAEKVSYEFGMFTFLCDELGQAVQESLEFAPGSIRLLGTGGSTRDERSLSALLESLLLHTRVLHDFFYKTDRKADDILAQDFIPDWPNVCPAKGPYFADGDRRVRLNKALAHLTRKRLEYDSHDKGWDVRAICSEIGAAIEKFIANLPPDRKSWFDDVTRK